MELKTGNCSICSFNNEVIKSEDCTVFWELISKIFKDDIPHLNEYQSYLKICPSCVYKIKLIDSKKAILYSEFSKETPTDLGHCGFCKSQENTELLKVGNSKIFKDFQPYKLLQEAGLSTCATCYFVMESLVNFKNSLTKLCKSRFSKRKLLENGEQQPETPVKLQKVKTENIPLNTSEIDLANEEKENESIKTPQRTFKKTQKNGLNLTNETPQKDTPSSTKTKTKTRKLEVDESTPKDENLESKRMVRGKVLRDRSKSSTPNKELIDPSPKKTNEVKCLPTKSSPLKKTEKVSESTEKEPPPLPKLKVSTKKLGKLNMSKPNLCNLVPLSAMDLQFGKEIKNDTKFFKFIPYIKLTIMKEGIRKKKGRQNGATMKTTLGPKPKKTFKRTPPIKIKFRQGKNINKPIKIRKRGKSISTSVEEKRKVIVKVARMKLSEDESDEIKTEKPDESVNILEEVVISSNEMNSSKDLTTPKKKKKVHFNDTPTIILTADDDDLDLDEETNKRDSDLEICQEEEEMDDIANLLEKDDFEDAESIGTIKASNNSESVEIVENTDKQKKDVIDIDDEDSTDSKTEVDEEKTLDDTINDTNKKAQVEKNEPPKDNDGESQNQQTEKDDQENATTVEENGQDTDVKNLDKDSALLDLHVIDECSNDEETEKTDFTMESHSTLGKVIETETNDDDDVIINNEMLSDAAEDKENFGSLIDEVQKCLTSSEEFPSLSNKQDSECPTVEILDDDDSLTCLGDLGMLKSSFTDDLIQDNDVAEKKTVSDKSSKRGANACSTSASSPKKSRLN